MRPLDTIRANTPNSFTTGAQYYLQGVKLLWRKELRPYIIVPLLVNIVIFIVLTSFLFHYFSAGMNYLLNWVPDFLHFLAWIIWLIAGALLLFFYGYIFNAITNLVASPFYGLLAQKTEELISGKLVKNEPSLNVDLIT